MSSSKVVVHFMLAVLIAAFLAACTVSPDPGTTDFSSADANALRGEWVGPGELYLPVDDDPSPDVLEFDLVVEMQSVDLTGSGLMANVLTMNGGTPGPELRLKVGDTVIAKVINKTDDPTTVHWHGIEMDNRNDGTPVTQNAIQPGATFTYKFKATRPGTFWYHSHAMPANKEFKGFFGVITVTDEADDKLTALGVLPEQRHTLVLADTTVCKEPGKNDAATFPADSSLPWAFEEEIGPYSGHDTYPTPKDLCESPRDMHGQLLDSGPLAAGEIPNLMPPGDCGSNFDCRVNEGQLVLTNGRVAISRAGTPEQPGKLGNGDDYLDVLAGQGVRLRTVNTTVTRYFRLLLTDQQGRKVNLMRVGGEGGLLDQARLEGGVQQDYNFKFAEGEILLANATRKDIVFTVPASAKVGDVLTLWTLDFRHYGTQKYPGGYAGVPTVPVAHFRVTGASDGPDYKIAVGDPLRLHGAVNDPIQDLRNMSITDHLLDPNSFEPPELGMPDETMSLVIVGQRESLDGVHGAPLEATYFEGGYAEVPHVYSSRWARVGDFLEISFDNRTQMHHPMHLHGFSFQPKSLYLRGDNEYKLIYEYPPEFVDTVDVPPSHLVVMRVKLEDRPYIDTGEPGGAAGRWLFHCHILNHAALGMITELVVLPEE